MPYSSLFVVWLNYANSCKLEVELKPLKENKKFIYHFKYIVSNQSIFFVVLCDILLHKVAQRSTK